MGTFASMEITISPKLKVANVRVKISRVVQIKPVCTQNSPLPSLSCNIEDEGSRGTEQENRCSTRPAAKSERNRRGSYDHICLKGREAQGSYAYQAKTIQFKLTLHVLISGNLYFLFQNQSRTK